MSAWRSPYSDGGHRRRKRLATPMLSHPKDSILIHVPRAGGIHAEAGSNRHGLAHPVEPALDRVTVKHACADEASNS